MRHGPAVPWIAGALCAGLLLPGPAMAQVTTNDGALDSLGAPARTRQPSRPAPHSTSHPAPARKPASAPAAPATPPAKPAKPAIPLTPPAILALPPAVAVPLAHPPPEPTIPFTADAPGEASPLPTGVRVTFGADRSDLNQASIDALARFAHTLLDQPTTSINIYAYATGMPDDPSTPRRLSLQRALAARAVLMKAGITSPRIYPRALGAIGGDVPDRVDVTTGAPTPPSTPTAAARTAG